MKVIEIYDRNSNILDNRKNIFKTLDKYMEKFPSSYRKCYDENVRSLELFKVDRIGDGAQSGIYNPEDNTIAFGKCYALGHELIHMATNDREKSQFAFESKMAIENGMIEGMTEYHHMQAFDLKLPGAYSFEVFTVMMLEDIPNLFESFFVPRENGILDICSDKKNVYSLLWSLENYNQMSTDAVEASAAGNEVLIDRVETRRCIRHVMDSLIAIKLLQTSDKKELETWGDKFIDLIKSDLIGDITPAFYPQYKEYAEKMIKKRIRGR